MPYLDWTGKNMGQNQSTTFGEGSVRKDSTDHLPQWPPSPPETQKLLLTPTSTTIKVEDGHCLPLPPPLNPADVRRQAQELDGWIALDDGGELMIATTTKKRKSRDLDVEAVARISGVGGSSMD